MELRRGLPLVVLAVLAAAIWLGTSASAQAASCAGRLDDTDVRVYSEPGRARAQPVDQSVLIAVAAPPGDAVVEARVVVELGPASWTVVDRAVPPGPVWSQELNFSNRAGYGVGLVEAVATAGLASGETCTHSVWLELGGASPLGTAAGLLAAAVLGVGIVIQGFGIVRGSLRKGGLRSALLGGVPTGAGALLLAQQFGATPIRGDSIVLWVIAPMAAGGLLNFGARRLWDRAAVPPEPESPDPPRSAFARLDCPDVVLARQPFELVVGLSSERDANVAGDELVRPATSVGPYTLAVEVMAEGFSLPSGQSRHLGLRVTAEAPYPTAVLHLTPEPQTERVRARSIRALFSIDGQTIGMAFRSVAVARTPDLIEEAAVEPQEAGIDFSVPTGITAPDITVRIVTSDESPDRLLWSMEVPSEYDVPMPSEQLVADIGRDPQLFARQIVDRISVREGRPGLFQYLTGVGRTVADEVPEAFWTVLRAVKQAIGDRPPLILFLSEDPYIPWELAVVEPPLDPGAPAFLSAQACVGRWILGHRRPALPPPVEAPVETMAVISGVYNRPGWARLEEAEQEAAALQTSYGAIPVDAAAEDVLHCFEGAPPADVLHFAVHGIYDPTGLQDGLVLADGHVLDPLEVKGSVFASSPFVFLNACQVGSGNKILGDYAGLAEAFLWAGASAVIAPLWSITDTVAKGIALRFYERVFDGEPVAEVLRDERTAFRNSDGVSATYIAYQFFGHPAMKLHRSSDGG